MLFGPAAEAKYGAPYLLAHRGDLHEALASIVPPDCLRLDHRLTGIDQDEGGVRLHFANGRTAEADLLIGADGVNSIVRSALFDESEPRFAGRIAYRTVFPARLLGGFDIGDCTKWWGEDRHIVMYPVKPDRSEIYFVTSQPEPEFGLESWSEKGDVKVLRAAFEGFHPDVQKVLAACPDVHKRVAGRPRAARPLGRRQGGAAGRRLPSDDALHGAGRGDGDRGCGDPVALPGGRRSRRHRRRARDLRSDAPGADGAGAAHLAPEQLGQGRHGHRLGLRLQRLDGAAGGRSAAGADGVIAYLTKVLRTRSERSE